MRHGTMGLVLLISLSFVIFSTNLMADAIITRDGKEIKGVVVEEYKDRYVISTAFGEMKVMKSNIKNIKLDEQDSNLIMLAEKARDVRDYNRAVAYYEQALKINPYSKAAKDGLGFLKLQVLQKEESKKKAMLSMQEEIDRYGSAPLPVKSGEEKEAALKQDIEDLTGMFISTDENFPKVVSVDTDYRHTMPGSGKVITSWRYGAGSPDISRLKRSPTFY